MKKSVLYFTILMLLFFVFQLLNFFVGSISQLNEESEKVSVLTEGLRHTLKVIENRGYPLGGIKIEESNIEDEFFIQKNVLTIPELTAGDRYYRKLEKHSVEKYGLNYPQFSLPFNLPETWYVSSPYGRYKYGWHAGTDFNSGQEGGIIASADGEVIFAGSTKYYGNLVRIRHYIQNQWWITNYAHLSVFQVKKGDIVKKGDDLGTVGNTGRSEAPHLHWSIQKWVYNVSEGKKRYMSVNPFHTNTYGTGVCCEKFKHF